jgi:HEAT repeat protein
VREKASAGLRKLASPAIPALKKAQADHPSAEVRLAAEGLIRRIEADELGVLRAVEALEWMGTPEARRLLKALAEGAPGAVTEAAKEALGRTGQ